MDKPQKKEYEVRDLKRLFETFSKDAYLDVLVPQSAHVDANALLNGNPERLRNLPSRRNLFFDEQASLLLVLKTSVGEEEAREILPYLELSIAAHATDAVPQGTGNAASASGKHDLTSQVLPAVEDAEIIPTNGQTCLVWKPTIHLPRPRVRLQRPAIYFTANLAVSAKALISARRPANEYLEPFEQLPENALDPLNFAPGFYKGKTIYLSADRLTKIAPSAPGSEDNIKPIRGASKRAYPAVPALFTKVRYSSLPGSIIASLHLETSHVITGTVSIEDVQVGTLEEQASKSPDWVTEPWKRPIVQDMKAVSFPQETQAGDETVPLYKLVPNKNASTQPGLETLTVSIKARANLDQGSKIPIKIEWQTQVDFAQTLVRLSYQWSQTRPVSTSSSQQKQLPTSNIPKRRSTEEAQDFEGINIRFAGPSLVHRLDEFAIHVHCKNNSARTRRFAIVSLQPKVPYNVTGQQEQASSKDADLVASIFAVPPLQHQKPADVQLLTPDVRIGPLPPGAVFETVVAFRAVGVGVLDLGIIRIVDVDTRQTVDVKDLPDVIALERQDDG